MLEIQASEEGEEEMTWSAETWEELYNKLEEELKARDAEVEALTKECAGLYSDSDKLQKALMTEEANVRALKAEVERLKAFEAGSHNQTTP